MTPSPSAAARTSDKTDGTAHATWTTTPARASEPPRPVLPNRHEVMALVDARPRRSVNSSGAAGAAAPAKRSSRRLPSRRPPGAGIEPLFEHVRTGLSRTEPAWRGAPRCANARPCTWRHRAAKSCIYMENQYFTSELMGRALAARLAEPSGPDIVLVSTPARPLLRSEHHGSDALAVHQESEGADRFGRFQIYSRSPLGRDIIVHAKVTFIDDSWCGSAPPT